jgi:hypothetical protein
MTITTLEIPYGDATLDLKVGMDQACAISDAFGGLVPAYQKITSWDMLACSAVVALGSGKPAAEVASVVYAQGLVVLTPLLDRYLNLLVNGGRDAAATAN